MRCKPTLNQLIEQLKKGRPDQIVNNKFIISALF